MPENNELKSSELMIDSDSESRSVKKKESGAFVTYIKLTGVLAAISALVALLLSVVNNFTADAITEGEMKRREETVFSIFSYADSVELYGTDEKSGSSIYLVYAEDKLCGYCVNVASNGFGGEINMMVGVSPDNSVESVKIISLSETPGVGSKTRSDSFLAQFAGKKGSLKIGDDVDAISGATISSKAVLEGVNTALACDIDISKIAAEKGKEIYSETKSDKIEG